MISDDMVITGKRAIARSYAKINLTLDILGKRDDGYHDVEMIMQTVSLFDLVIVDKTTDRISVSTNLKYLPSGEKNIAHKAAVKFFEHTGIRKGAKIIIHKNIPVAAGLAGGSGNAAAVLCALNLLYDSGLSTEELCKIGATLGADVPYCILCGTYMASGIGDILTPMPSPPDAYVLLVKPGINVSTKEIYDDTDRAELINHPDTAAMINALKSGDIYAVSKNLCNTMETVTAKKHPQVSGIKQKLIQNGAQGAVMSGSGPTVFGIFDDYSKAKHSADSFAYQYKDVYLTKFHK